MRSSLTPLSTQSTSHKIETFLEPRQSSSSPDVLDIGSLRGQNGVRRTCGQRCHWAAVRPAAWQGWSAVQRGKADWGNGKERGNHPAAEEPR